MEKILAYHPIYIYFSVHISNLVWAYSPTATVCSLKGRSQILPGLPLQGIFDFFVKEMQPQGSNRSAVDPFSLKPYQWLGKYRRCLEKRILFVGPVVYILSDWKTNT